MFLKRLEIKGFKSFADATTINLEPGISAIVGPNGSGKSNICDAILWVLGERNAKSLRGSVMEDVIFAGSKTRNPVQFAEVTLVLDNTDRTIPLDFSDISVSRRLYRSGESEYLVNGSIARRLDVLDILHDSGLGSDTNSIISQGQLDSILQSKPADRRALIEEAAGVLKHKQRKIRSLHKIDKMNQNLARIEDVMAEIERSLKPLRIKAKRARAYGDLKNQLKEYNVALCVDDLRNIKNKYSFYIEKKQNYSDEINSNNKELDVYENKLNELRNSFSKQNKLVVEHANKQTRFNSCIDKFDAYTYVLNNKADEAKKNIENYESKSDGKNQELSPLINQLKDIRNQLEKQLSSYHKLKDQIIISEADLSRESDKKNKLQSQSDSLSGLIQDKQSRIKGLRDNIDNTRDSIFDAQAKMQSAKSTCSTIKNQIEQLDNKIEEEQKLKEDHEEKYNNFVSNVDALIAEKDTYSNKLISLQNEENSIRDSLNEVVANIVTCQKIIESDTEKNNSVAGWINNNEKILYKQLDDQIDVDEKYFNITEKILGNYAQAFVANSYIDALDLKKELDNYDDLSGDFRVIYPDTGEGDLPINKARDFAKINDATCLADKIECTNAAIKNLFSNVIVFNEAKFAKTALEANNNYIIASLDGFVAYPDNKAIVYQQFNDASSKKLKKSIFAYKRELKKNKKLQRKYDKKLSSLNEEKNKIKDKLDDLSKNIEEIEHLSRVAKSDLDISLKNIENYNTSLDVCKNDLETADVQYKNLKSTYSACSPQLDKYKDDLKDLEQTCQKDVKKYEILQPYLNSQKDAYEKAKDNHNKLLLEKVSKKENIKFLKSKINSYKENIKKQKIDIENNKLDYDKNKIIYKRCIYLAKLFLNLKESAALCLEKMNLDSSNLNNAADKLQDQQNELIAKINLDRQNQNELNSKLSNCNVEIAKLEVNTQNVLDALDTIEGISVDTALEMPVLENREEIEIKATKLKKRLTNMGEVSQESIKEYNELKNRYDYFNEAVTDLKTASDRLYKITKIIDDKIRDKFVETFYIVNDNFKDIFTILFPGGSAHLELDNAEDIDNCGVEVIAQPSGKHLSKMSLLSGGEKSLVALCLLFAVYKTRETPFYILDEVEAALDDTNLQRLIKYLTGLSSITQLIMITHQRRSMEMADVLYGVSMNNDGVTKVIRQKLEK